MSKEGSPYAFGSGMDGTGLCIFCCDYFLENHIIVIIGFMLLDGIGDEFSPGFMGGGDGSHILNEFFIT